MVLHALSVVGTHSAFGPKLAIIGGTENRNHHDEQLIRFFGIGSLARIGPNHLLTSDPEVWRRILGARSNYERGPWFDHLRLNPHTANLITERNIRKHNALRYQMAAGVSTPD